MYNKTVSIVGSWRPDEHEGNATAEKERFYAIAEMLGVLTHEDGHKLRVIWSNDHLTDQCMPILKAGSIQGEILDDGRYKIKPENVKYLFEDSADYHAFVGYLRAARRNLRKDGKIQLLISDEMWLGSSEKGTVAWEPVLAHMIEGFPMIDYVNKGLIEISPVNEKTLRSVQVSNLTTGEDPVDALLTLGGGKATLFASNAAKAEGKLIPVPHCGSEGWNFLESCYAEKAPNEYGRLINIYGPLPETKERYTSMTVEAVRSQLKDCVETFLIRPEDRKKKFEPPCRELS